jgi:hypothetical protein
VCVCVCVRARARLPPIKWSEIVESLRNTDVDYFSQHRPGFRQEKKDIQTLEG